MNNLPHPLHGAADHFTDDAIRAATDGEQDHAGITTVHGIAPLPLQAAKFDLFARAKRAYPNYVFHGDTSRAKSRKHPLEVSYSYPQFAAARKSTYFNCLQRESCQLKTALDPHGPEDLAATIYTLMDIDPNDEFYTPEGRPVTIVNNGKVIRGLL